MSTLTRTDPATVTDVKVTAIPRSGQTVSGYGGAVPTRYMIRVGVRWHRVEMMQYGNSGSPYVLIGGAVHHLDIDTEYRLQAL